MYVCICELLGHHWLKIGGGEPANWTTKYLHVFVWNARSSLDNPCASIRHITPLLFHSSPGCRLNTPPPRPIFFTFVSNTPKHCFLFSPCRASGRRLSKNNAKPSSEASFTGCQHLQKHLYCGRTRADWRDADKMWLYCWSSCPGGRCWHYQLELAILRLIQTQTIFPSFAPVGAGFPELFGSLTSFKGVTAFDVNDKASNGEELVRVKKWWCEDLKSFNPVSTKISTSINPFCKKCPSFKDPFPFNISRNTGNLFTPLGLQKEKKKHPWWKVVEV